MGWLDGLFGKKQAAPKAQPPAPPPVKKPPPAAPPPDPLGLPDFLARMRIGDRASLGAADYDASAKRVGIPAEIIRAVVQVECSGKPGFGSGGLPVILFEPHVFSRLTGNKYDKSNPDVSYPAMDPKKYPQTQDERWKQLGKAFLLDREAALQAASWGAFQILGINFQACGFQSAAAFAAHLAGSEARQLEAFEAFITSHKLVDALKNKRWKDFAKKYNGPRYADSYGAKIETAYKALVAQGKAKKTA